MMKWFIKKSYIEVVIEKELKKFVTLNTVKNLKMFRMSCLFTLAAKQTVFYNTKEPLTT